MCAAAAQRHTNMAKRNGAASPSMRCRGSPDRNSDPGAEDQFIKIAFSYEVWRAQS